MSRTFTWNNIALSIALTAGMVGFAGIANAQNTDQNGIQTAQRQLEIRNAQQALKTSGYYKGSVDGIDGAATRAAIRNYQRANNLTVDGRLDRATCNRLGLAAGEDDRSMDDQDNGARDTTAARGRNASNNTNVVQAAQQQLQAEGMYSGAIDGVMDGKTASALRNYQRQNGLQVTGTLNKETLTSLGVSR